MRGQYNHYRLVQYFWNCYFCDDSHNNNPQRNISKLIFLGGDILGVDILGVDILGVDILGVDILGVYIKTS